MYLTRFSVIWYGSCQDVSQNSALGNTYWGRRENGNNLNLPMRFGWYHYSLHMSWMSILYISILIYKITVLIPTSLSFCRISEIAREKGSYTECFRSPRASAFWFSILNCTQIRETLSEVFIHVYGDTP